MFTNVLLFTLAVLGSPDNTKSVMVPTPATQEAAPATPCSPPQFVCENGKCRRVVSVEEQTYETARRRFFGGHVTRNGTRTVYKTSRR
jgi:hypothetical protein